MKLYHYTHHTALTAILSSGFLLPTKEFETYPSPTGKRIKAPIWLSTNEYLDMAVIKPFKDQYGNPTKFLSVEDYRAKLGLARIQVKPSNKTLSWKRLTRAIGLPANEAKGMEQGHAKDGTITSEVHGYIGKIKVKDFLSIETMNDKGEWVEYVY